jgi:peptidoglycan/xylan/chitin deacetylase (PgdA/CDA1 family)
MEPNSSNIFVLNFHGLGEPAREMRPTEYDCWLGVPIFERILDSVRGRADVRITFDDSNESDYSIALPRLKARGMCAQFFLVAGWTGRGAFLSADQIKALHAEGMEIGAHGMTHCRWKGLSEGAVREELVDAKDSIAQIIGAPVLDAACPGGVYGRRTLRNLRQYGYRAVYTSDGGPTSLSSWLRPRNTVRRSHSFETTQRSLTEIPPGRRKIWRELKLLIKRWR